MTFAGRYLRTLPHLRPWQIAGRVLAPVRRRIVRHVLPEVPEGLSCGFQPQTEFLQHEPWNDRADMLRGRFRFLNRTSELGRPVDWSAPDEPLLWRFNLHYFQYLHLLEPDEQRDLCREWVQANPVGRTTGWHPYPTSLRIVNWCKAGLADEDLLESLYLQAAWLSRNLETYVYGNHLIENARALVVAGRYFGSQGEAPAWLDKGLSILDAELSEQVLEDGCHFERSPMYQALMLEAVLDVVNLLEEDHPSREHLVDVATRMTGALATLTHPDGRIALLNDSTLEIAPSTESLSTYAQRLIGHSPHRRPSLPDAGYYVATGPGSYLVVDAGAPGPDYLMAHAHADIFSYELSLGGKRFVVDAGVFEYAAGEMRDYVRSTRAHSTVSIDGLEQIECWGSFRVGRRSEPQDVHFQADNECWTLSGSFKGFAAVTGEDIVHQRTITVEQPSGQVRVLDKVTGTGPHTVSSRIHLHPDVEIEGDPPLILRRGEAVCRLEAHDGAFVRENGWYCPEFGRRIQSPVLLLEVVGELPIELGYTLDPQSVPAPKSKT